jgi:putative ABC transport system permease protein
MTWRLAYRNLFRNRRRTLATCSAIVAGFVGLIVLGAFIFRVERTLRVNAIYMLHHGHAIILKQDSLEKYATRPAKFQIKEDEQSQINQALEKFRERIEWVGQSMTGTGLISNGLKSKPFIASGVDPLTLEKGYTHPMVQNWATDFLTEDGFHFIESLKKDPRAVSVTVRLGELLGKKPPFTDLRGEEQSLQLAGLSIFNDLSAADANLVASHTTGSELAEDTSVRTSLSLLQELYQTQGVQSVMIYLKEEKFLTVLLDQLNAEFKQRQLPLIAYPYTHPEISQHYVGTMGFLYVMSGFFIFLICGAVALSIVNSLTMGILERTREIGTLRAIGFERHQISLLFAQEGIWMTLLGGTAALIISFIISVLIRGSNVTFTPPGISAPLHVIITPYPLLVLVVFSCFLLLIGLTSYLVTHFKLKSTVVELLTDAGA